jgi:hypothetical protein
MDTDGDGNCPDGDLAGDDFENNPLGVSGDVPDINMEIVFEGPCANPDIPTVTGWGMILSVLLMSGVALWVLRRRKSAI